MNNDNNQGWGGGGGWGSAPQDQGAMGGGGSVWAGFDQIESAPSRAPYIPAGFSGVLGVKELKVIKSVKNRNRPVFVASFEVIDGAINGEAVRAGSQFDWVAKADELPYLQNIKALVVALNPDADPRSFGAEIMEALTGPDQPAKGLQVSARAEEILTRAGNSFTKVHWFAI